MNFSNSVDFQLHYTDIQLMGENIDENSIQVKYWDNAASNWITVDDVTFNSIENTVAFSSDEVSNFVILSGNQLTTGINDDKDLIVKGFKLKQNYPNPFNPETNIEFELKTRANVTLSIYNLLGQHVLTLLNETMNNGKHIITFEADNLASGTYYYVLGNNRERIVKKMILLK